MSYSLNKCKLIIFDLDNTIWDGILSEGEVVLKQNIGLLFKSITDHGIIISICSKNDFEQAKNKLLDFDLWKYIVFPSIDWSRKGQRIAQMLNSMGLRDENTLFIDDSIENLEEAKFFNNRIMTESPNALPNILNELSNIKITDSAHTKLKQYKELESREKEKAKYSNNTEFLKESKISVFIKLNDTQNYERILQLIQKTNQLNFTKKRSDKNELKKEILEAKKWGTVFAKDIYSDYGLVGFFLVDQQNTLQHFLFSCRTIGMGVEQYVYEILGFPNLKIVEPVSTKIKKEKNLSFWINSDKSIKNKQTKTKKIKTTILFKGPCDLSVITGYLEEKGCRINVEFSHMDEKNRFIEHQNTTTNILNTLLPSEKQDNLASNPFWHNDLTKTTLFNRHYDIVVLSMLTDFTIPTYYSKKFNLYYSCGQYGYPLTDSRNWSDYKKGNIFNAGFSFSDEELAFFSENYEYVETNPLHILKNIKRIRELLPKDTSLLLTLGSEIEYSQESNKVYKNAAKYHKQLNDLLRSENMENVFLIDPNKTINIIGQNAFTNNINHYNKQVYIQMAKDINSIVEELGYKGFVVRTNRNKLFAKIKRFFFQKFRVK